MEHQQRVFTNEQETLILEIEEDFFSAYLTIKETDSFINEKDLQNLIKQAEIKHGFNSAESFIQKNSTPKDFNIPFPIAIGDRPVQAQVEFSPLFDLTSSFDPKTFDNDFSKLTNFISIKAEEPLAHLFVSKPGKQGINVFSEKVGDELSESEVLEKYLGENVYYSSERSQIMSSSSGYPYVDEENRMCVKTDFTIDGNLDLNSDSFYLKGNLLVNGNIQDKIKLKVDGNLTVNGDINDAEIEVNGYVKINGDILNCKKSSIRVDGNIEFETAENSKIICSNEIKFTGISQFSSLIAGKNIIGSGDSTAIIGGLAQSGENIEVAVIGSSNAVGTEVEITISPYVKEQMLLITKKLMTLKSKPAVNAEEIKHLTEIQQQLEAQLEKEINKTILSEDTTPRHILAFKKIYGGTYLRILKRSQTILEEINRVSFSLSEGELIADKY
ncbi:MAG: FapA family protein [Candidatus Cloacimonetes bacterium]|nr:FapA family protein [Candidatus Cloacimonadota bacterium]